jgi:putative ABC transport system permease protein
MLSRIVGRSLTRRRRRKLLGLAAVTLGIAVTTAVATIALDVGDRVGRELRSFGANISVTPAADGLPVAVGGVDYRPVSSGAFLAEADLVRLKKIFWHNDIEAFAPFLYLPVAVQGRRVVMIGSWFDKAMRVERSEVFRTGLKKLHPVWQVQGGWPDDADPASCLVGHRLAESLNVRVGQTLAFSVPRGLRSSIELTVRGILETGGPEDEHVWVPLVTVQEAGEPRRGRPAWWS